MLLDICEISPFEKWTHYRVVPVKFLLHVALVVLTTACIVEDSVRWVESVTLFVGFLLIGLAS